MSDKERSRAEEEPGLLSLLRSFMAAYPAKKLNPAMQEVLDYTAALRTQLAESKKIQNRVNNQEYWFWQGNGDDHPESLGCPVIMQADTLRALLNTPRQAERAGYVVVPVTPTPEMRGAYKNAIRNLIESVPPDQRKWRTKKHGYDIPADEKLMARWEAMINAAPAPPAPPLSQQAEQTVSIREGVFKWLLGEGPHPDTGAWFERPEGRKGNFWWRTELRAALNAAPQERPVDTNGVAVTGHIGSQSEGDSHAGEGLRVPAGVAPNTQHSTDGNSQHNSPEQRAVGRK